MTECKLLPRDLLKTKSSNPPETYSTWSYCFHFWKNVWQMWPDSGSGELLHIWCVCVYITQQLLWNWRMSDYMKDVNVYIKTNSDHSAELFQNGNNVLPLQFTLLCLHLIPLSQHTLFVHNSSCLWSSYPHDQISQFWIMSFYAGFSSHHRKH